MTFGYKTTLRLVTIRPFESEAGKKMTFVKLADTATFDSVELILSRSQNVASISEGKDYTVALEVDGRYSSVTLIDAPPSAGKTPPPQPKSTRV